MSAKVLYIVYWGAGEPLGQSLVIPSVKRLAQLGADLTLITFEKTADLDRENYSDRIQTDLESDAVKWLPLRYHRSPKIPATLFDIAQGVIRSLAMRWSRRFDVVHARTFVGGLIGLVVAPLIGARFVYHNEGFYPDEQVDGGVWREGDIVHRVAKWLELRMYVKADGIVALSHRAKLAIESLVARPNRKPDVIVVPSCVDLNFFRSSDSEKHVQNGRLRLVYSGSVGGRYLLDKIGTFVSVAAQEHGNVHLDVLTRGDRNLVSAMLTAGGLSETLWSSEAVSFSEMPRHLSGHSAGLLFWPSGLSEHGTSPTKVGEYWAMGLPVVSTPNVSDVEQIIRSERVGVIVREHSQAAYREALQELRELLDDEDLASRCRKAAETHYQLDSACQSQVALYHRLTEGVGKHSRIPTR